MLRVVLISISVSFLLSACALQDGPTTAPRESNPSFLIIETPGHPSYDYILCVPEFTGIPECTLSSVSRNE